MNLDMIEAEGRNGNEQREVISALERLPEGTIQGLSGEYGARAKILKEKERRSILVYPIESHGRPADSMHINVPKEAAGLRAEDLRTADEVGVALSFEYLDRTYHFSGYRTFNTN